MGIDEAKLLIERFCKNTRFIELYGHGLQATVILVQKEGVVIKAWLKSALVPKCRTEIMLSYILATRRDALMAPLLNACVEKLKL